MNATTPEHVGRIDRIGRGERFERARALLAEVDARHRPSVFTTSFGAEDMVLLDLIARHRLGVAIVTLDTGRLPEATYELWRRTEERYRLRVTPFVPDTGALQSYIRINGVNAFYDSVAQRLECCRVRKVEPLQRALAGHQAWVTGLRRAQSLARAQVEFVGWDDAHQMHKFNPLADWEQDDVWAYIREFDVPYNILHDAGYPSIGCAPCTRALQPGEDERAGRWWWEEASARECGLHVAEGEAL